MIRRRHCTGLAILAIAANVRADSRVYPIPDGEPRSPLFAVSIDGLDSPVYSAKVPLGDDALRARVVDDFEHHGDEHDDAAFTAFDVDDRADVAVTCPKPPATARVLPTSAKVDANIEGRVVRFAAQVGQQLTLEIDGDIVRSLHVFANPTDRDVPRADDPDVIFLGPGIHESAETLDVSAGKTLYLAAGAVLRSVGDSREPLVRLHGDRPALRGRGVIDGGRSPIHSRNLVAVLDARHAVVEGVTLVDAPVWNLPIRRSDDARVENVKLIGFRANSDGIDVCNSRDVLIDRCFARTCDDLVVVKTDRGQGEARNVSVRRCVLWNAFAHALSIGAELAEPVTDVTFEDCDVIHDVGREWTFRVFQCDDALVSGARFRDIRVEESRRLISLWIGKFVWSRTPERGHVSDVTFERVAATGGPLTVTLEGFDAAHPIERVAFDGVTVNGRPLAPGDVARNAFVGDVTVRP